MSGRDEWVRVESEDELRPGMAIQARTCSVCGKPENRILIRRDGDTWTAIPRCDGLTMGGLWFAISGGRIFRLRDLPDEQATETARPKTLEVVR